MGITLWPLDELVRLLVEQASYPSAW